MANTGSSYNTFPPLKSIYILFSVLVSTEVLTIVWPTDHLFYYTFLIQLLKKYFFSSFIFLYRCIDASNFYHHQYDCYLTIYSILSSTVEVQLCREIGKQEMALASRWFLKISPFRYWSIPQNVRLTISTSTPRF